MAAVLSTRALGGAVAAGTRTPRSARPAQHTPLGRHKDTRHFGAATASWASPGRPLPIGWRCPAARVSMACRASAMSREDEVLGQLERIIDPDFGMDIVACGFVKDLKVSYEEGTVDFRLVLTTPACPVKDEFERQAREYVGSLPWVKDIKLVMDAQTQSLMSDGDGRAGGLKDVAHVIAVSSCKGGVGKSTTSVNLAYTLAQMGAKVGIFDADIYGPSLPTMISPELRVLQMDPETKAITPVDYEGVKVVSFGFAGQGAAIMRGAMVSGVVQQLLQTTEWGKLDYLIIDFPPGTGDIQLTLCQSVAITAAVIVTTPQKLSFIDVAKGIRMFAKLRVPCVAVAENMSYFEAEGKTYYPFGTGSGERIQRDYGMDNLVKFPIVPDLSAAGDNGLPLVVSDPLCAVSRVFSDLGATVVREVAKLKLARKNVVRFDEELAALVVRLPDQSREESFLLSPAVVRRNDTSAKSIDEWTGEKLLDDSTIPDDIRPADIQPLGNYAVQISWEDGFNQVAAFDLLEGLERMPVPDGFVVPEEDSNGDGAQSPAQQIMSRAAGEN